MDNPRRFAAMTLLAALAAAPATRPTQTFTSDEYAFQLKVPADWVVPEHPDPGQAFTARTPPLPSTRPAPPGRPVLTLAAVGLKVDAGPEGASDPQILRDDAGALAGLVFEHGGEHVTIRPGTMGGMPARRVRYTVDRPDGRAEVLTVMTVHKRLAYVLTVAAPAGQLNGLMPDVEAMLASFDLRD